MNVMDRSMKALQTSLNLRQLRQEVIASNIANSQTPGYKAKVLDFEAALNDALDIDETVAMNATDPKHYNVGGGGLDTLRPEIYDNPNGEVSIDGNTVDSEQEMSAMANNKILYDASVQLLNKKLSQIKYVLGNER